MIGIVIVVASFVAFIALIVYFEHKHGKREKEKEVKRESLIGKKLDLRTVKSKLKEIVPSGKDNILLMWVDKKKMVKKIVTRASYNMYEDEDIFDEAILNDYKGILIACNKKQNPVDAIKFCSSAIEEGIEITGYYEKTDYGFEPPTEDELFSKWREQIGSVIHNRVEALKAMQELLTPFHQKLIECLVVISLDNRNIVKNIDVQEGTTYTVQYPISDVLDFVIANKSSKVILGHNHPISRATPSDADVVHGANLYLAAKEQNIEILDDLVICEEELKSIMNTLRFKQLIRKY